jgi:hypothetical protein
MQSIPNSLTLTDLDAVHGGMRWEDFRQSDNVEDRRPQSEGGPVPDEQWQEQQAQLEREAATSCDPNDPWGDGTDPSEIGDPFAEPLTDQEYEQGMNELSDMSESLDS